MLWCWSVTTELYSFDIRLAVKQPWYFASSSRNVQGDNVHWWFAPNGRLALPVAIDRTLVVLHSAMKYSVYKPKMTALMRSTMPLRRAYQIIIVLVAVPELSEACYRNEAPGDLWRTIGRFSQIWGYRRLRMNARCRYNCGYDVHLPHIQMVWRLPADLPPVALTWSWSGVHLQSIIYSLW